MHLSSAMILTTLSFAAQVFAAPASTSISVAKRDTSSFATNLQNTFTSMSSGVTAASASLNASAKANNGKPSLMVAISTLQEIGGNLTGSVNAVASNFDNPILDFTIEDIQILVNVLGIYSSVLTTVEETVDAVVNAFFPGFLDLFKPFIQIWISVVDSFTQPFLDFYTNLVGTLTGSPELVAEINDYISVIEKIRDNFLLAF